MSSSARNGGVVPGPGRSPTHDVRRGPGQYADAGSTMESGAAPIGLAVDRGRLLGAQPRPQRDGHPRAPPALAVRPRRGRGPGACSAATPPSQTTDSFDAVLDDPAVDAVAIATPAATHFAAGHVGAGRRKHVLVEKPLTSDLADGQKLVAGGRGPRPGARCATTRTATRRPCRSCGGSCTAASSARSSSSTPSGSTSAWSSPTSTSSGTWHRTTCRSSTSSSPRASASTRSPRTAPTRSDTAWRASAT